jgi:ribosomal protein S18 acetylase RimI-like enzyme
MVTIPQFKSLQGVTLEGLCNTFNDAFSDYIVPLHLTPSILQQKIEGENLQLPYSIGAFFNNTLGGFILNAPDSSKRPGVLYNGGTGVIKPYRGQKLVQQMYEHFIPAYQQKGINLLLLEVITTNTPAIRAYESTGFRKLRVFQCFKGDIQPAKKAADLSIVINPNPDWNKYSLFMDMIPSWTNNTDSMIREVNYSITWEARMGERTVGFLTIHKESRRIRNIVVAKDQRRKGIGNALLQHATKQLSGPFSIINIDEEQKGITAFLEQAGLKQYLSQYEMGMDI